MTRAAHPLPALAAALLMAACSDDGTGPGSSTLEITETTPDAGDAGVEVGQTIDAVFSHALDPASLSTRSFQVWRDGALVRSAIDYDASSRTGRAVTPLLPGESYEVEITPRVSTPAGATLGAPRVWSFTTRDWAPVILESGTTGQDPSLAVDETGRLHATYLAFPAPAQLRYLTCAAACGTVSSWDAVDVEAGGSGNSVTVDQTGRIHVSHRNNDGLRYATCASTCEEGASWQAVTIDAVGSTGLFSSLAADGTGRLHVSYHDETNGDLRYATCPVDCLVSGNWETVTVDDLFDTGDDPSLAVDANGRVHVAYHGADTEDLKYATCPGDCDTPVNWQDTRVDGRGLTPYIVGRDPSLAVDGGGRLHVSYRVVDTNDLKYATCEVDCDQAANWQTVTVDAVGAVGFGSSLAVDANGRIHVSYPDNGGQELRYATCAADCELAAGWETTAWETAAGGGVGATSLAVAGNGSVHIAYRDTGVPSGALAYVQ